MKAYFLENIKSIVFHNDNFKNKYFIKTDSGGYYDIYYVKVLCDENFIKWFLDNIPWLDIINEKTTNQEKMEKISVLINCYINDKAKVLSDFVYYAIQKKRIIETKTDAILVLKEYGHLITMPTRKLDTVTSTRFINNFLISMNITDWETYKNSEDFIVNHMSSLKQHYYVAIMHYLVKNPNHLAMNYLFNIVGYDVIKWISGGAI